MKKDGVTQALSGLAKQAAKDIRKQAFEEAAVRIEKIKFYNATYEADKTWLARKKEIAKILREMAEE